MKADREFGGGGDGGPEELRRLLRHWRVPGAPPEIEQQLRQTFRRGRSRRRRLVWLAVAASLAVTAILALTLVRPIEPPRRIANRPALVSPPAAPPITVEPKLVATRGPVHAPALHAKRTPAAPPAENEVIVEPGQAELLVQLARQLRGARQAGPGVSVPRIEVLPADAPPSPIRKAETQDEVRQHGTHWQRVETEWPSAQLSL